MVAARVAGTPAALLDRLRLDSAASPTWPRGLGASPPSPTPWAGWWGGSRLPNGLQLERVTVAAGRRRHGVRGTAQRDLRRGGAVPQGGRRLRPAGRVARAALERCDSGLRSSRGRGAPGFPPGPSSFRRAPGTRSSTSSWGSPTSSTCSYPAAGRGLIRRCVENSRVPVIETGTGNCHVYVHARADLAMALEIILNAKTQRPRRLQRLRVGDRRPGGCRALPARCALGALPGGCARARRRAGAYVRPRAGHGADAVVAAREEDWGREGTLPWS